jgi:hypothetical protein
MNTLPAVDYRDPALVLAAILAIYLRLDVDDPDECVIELCVTALHAQGYSPAQVNAMVEEAVVNNTAQIDPLDWEFAGVG